MSLRSAQYFDASWRTKQRVLMVRLFISRNNVLSKHVDLNAVHVVTDDVRNVMSDVSGFVVMRFVVVRFVVVAVDVGVVVGVVVAGVLRVVPFVVGVMLHVVHVAEVAQHSGCLVFHSRFRKRFR